MQSVLIIYCSICKVGRGVSHGGWSLLLAELPSPPLATELARMLTPCMSPTLHIKQ